MSILNWYSCAASSWSQEARMTTLHTLAGCWNSPNKHVCSYYYLWWVFLIFGLMHCSKRWVPSTPDSVAIDIDSCSSTNSITAIRCAWDYSKQSNQMSLTVPSNYWSTIKVIKLCYSSSVKYNQVLFDCPWTHLFCRLDSNSCCKYRNADLIVVITNYECEQRFYRLMVSKLYC